MALLCQYQQCNFSRPMRLQFLWKDGREMLALKASFRIRLIMVWNHLESTCNESASNSQRLEQGARLGQLCRYKRERRKTRRSSRWSLSLCRKFCIYLKEARREIKRLLVERATVRVSTCVRQLMHAFARSLKTQHLKGLRKCSDQFHMVQDIALICPNAQQARPFEACCCLRSNPPEAAFKQFARASRNMHFQMTDGMKQQKILM